MKRKNALVVHYFQMRLTSCQQSNISQCEVEVKILRVVANQSMVYKICTLFISDQPHLLIFLISVEEGNIVLIPQANSFFINRTSWPVILYS